MAVRACRLALALLPMLLPGAAEASGLGPLTVLSPLGQPFEAEAALIGGDGDASSLSARAVAPHAYGRPVQSFSLRPQTLHVTVAKRPGGERYVRITSTRTVREPLVSLLIELDAGRSRFARGYTALVDLPDLDAPGTKPEWSAPAAPVRRAASRMAPAGVKRSEPARAGIAPELSEALQARARALLHSAVIEKSALNAAQERIALLQRRIDDLRLQFQDASWHSPASAAPPAPLAVPLADAKPRMAVRDAKNAPAHAASPLSEPPAKVRVRPILQPLQMVGAALLLLFAGLWLRRHARGRIVSARGTVVTKSQPLPVVSEAGMREPNLHTATILPDAAPAAIAVEHAVDAVAGPIDIEPEAPYDAPALDVAALDAAPPTEAADDGNAPADFALDLGPIPDTVRDEHVDVEGGRPESDEDFSADFPAAGAALPETAPREEADVPEGKREGNEDSTGDIAIDFTDLPEASPNEHAAFDAGTREGDPDWRDVQEKFDLIEAYRILGAEDEVIIGVIREIIDEGDARQRAAAKRLLAGMTKGAV